MLRRSRTSLTALVAAAVVAAASGAASSPAWASPAISETPEVVVVLDSSGSMAEADAGGGQTRMEAAKQAVTELATTTPDTTRIGLRTYGDGVDSQAPGSCEDTTLRVPVGPVDRDALTQQVQDLAPRGDTPIGTALLAAAGDFTGAGPQSVVLVSDGEPTCDPDPCPVAAQLAEQGIDLRIDVIGFRVDAAARAVLECIADSGGGQYVDAADAGELAEALDTSLDRSFRTYLPQGTPIQGTPTSEGAPSLGEGQFLDQIPTESTLHYTVDLDEGETLRAGATIVRADGSRDGVGGFVTLRTFDEAGEQCFTELSTGGAEQGSAPITGGLLHGPATVPFEPESCSSAGTFLLEVEWSNAGGSGGLPMELVVDLEPAVRSAPAGQQPFSDESTSYPEPERPAGDPVEVTGGTSPNDATELGTGLFSDTIRKGETVYYGVPLDWGQQLAFRADFPELVEGSTVEEALGSNAFVNMQLLSPYRAPVTPLGDSSVRLDTVSRDGASVWTTTHPVAFANREEGAYGQLRHMSQPGEVVVQLSLAEDSTTAEETALAFPFTLSVDVLGEVLDAPVYEEPGTSASAAPAPDASEAPAPEPSPSGSPSPAGEPVAAVTEAAQDDDGSGSTLVPVLAAAAALLALALVGLVSYGVVASRRGRDGPGS